MNAREYEELKALREIRDRLEERAAYHTEVEGMQREQIRHLKVELESVRAQVAEHGVDIACASHGQGQESAIKDVLAILAKFHQSAWDDYWPDGAMYVAEIEAEVKKLAAGE